MNKEKALNGKSRFLKFQREKLSLAGSSFERKKIEVPP